MSDTCQRGHSLARDGVVVDGRGHRRCRVCRDAARDRRWARKHPGHPTAWAHGRRVCLTCNVRYQYDRAAVERAVYGDPPATLTSVERREVVLTLARRGVPGKEIAERARCARRTVWRILRRAREAEQEVPARAMD